jgi:hypothetical protein
MFPLCDRLRLVRPKYCLSDRCARHPLGILAMRLPALLPFPKWSMVRTLGSTNGRSDVPPRTRHRVILAWFRWFFLGSGLAPDSGVSAGPPRACFPKKESPRNFSALWLLRNCHIALARVTLLATIASATEALGRDSNFVTLISHQNLSARVSRQQEEKFGRAVMRASWLADESTELTAYIPVSTSHSKG